MLIDVLNKDQYDEFIITGGEPLLRWDRTAYIIEQIKHRNKNAWIILYTSMVIDEMADVFDMVDGITYSLHAPFSDEDLSAFLKVQTLAEFFYDTSCYLNVESHIDRDIPINPCVWKRIQSFYPQYNCPVPEGEDLYRIMEVF
jgi:organic radical activating enzyme